MDYNHNLSDLKQLIRDRKNRAAGQRHKYQIREKTSRKWELWNQENNEVYIVTKPNYSEVFQCNCKDFKFRIKDARKNNIFWSRRKSDKKINCKHIQMIKNLNN